MGQGRDSRRDAGGPVRVVVVGSLVAADLDGCDFSSDITAEVAPPYADPWQSVPVLPRRKDHGFDPAAWLREAEAPRVLLVASIGEGLAGYAALSASWNGMAEIDEIAVDRAARRRGVASLLLAEAEAWAASSGFSHLRLETQADNVAACRAYVRAGFVLGGHDRCLYAAGPHAGEVALFWYRSLGAA